MKIINDNLLDHVSAQARASERLRMNYNIHDDTDEPLNRLLNAMECGTYIRPHRHTNPSKCECVIVLKGELATLIFDDKGNVKDITVVNPQEGIYGVDIAPDEWHMFIVMQPGTVIYELKPGPFTPISDLDWGPWAPLPQDTEAVGDYIASLQEVIKDHKKRTMSL